MNVDVYTLSGQGREEKWVYLAFLGYSALKGYDFTIDKSPAYGLILDSIYWAAVIDIFGSYPQIASNSKGHFTNSTFEFVETK